MIQIFSDKYTKLLDKRMYTWHFAKINSQQGKIFYHIIMEGYSSFSEAYLCRILSWKPLTVPGFPVEGFILFTVLSVSVPIWGGITVWLTGLVVVAVGELLRVVPSVPGLVALGLGLGVLPPGGRGRLLVIVRLLVRGLRLPVVLSGLWLPVIVWTGVNVSLRGVPDDRFSRILSPPPPVWPPLVFTENRSAIKYAPFRISE